MFSIGYLRTAGRLTIVVMKGRNLPRMTVRGTGEDCCAYSDILSEPALYMHSIVTEHWNPSLFTRSFCEGGSHQRRPQNQEEEDIHEEDSTEPCVERGALLWRQRRRSWQHRPLNLGCSPERGSRLCIVGQQCWGAWTPALAGHEVSGQTCCPLARTPGWSSFLLNYWLADVSAHGRKGGWKGLDVKKIQLVFYSKCSFGAVNFTLTYEPSIFKS